MVPAFHAVPSQAKTRPSESTARQKVGVGQETPVSPELSPPDPGGSEATDWGAEKPSPFHVTTLPLLSARTQNAADAQETALSWP